MTKLSDILAANAKVLMNRKYGKLNVSRLAAEKNLSVGVAGRIKDAKVVQVDSLEACAEAFSMEPWQMLVPDLIRITRHG